MDMLALKIGAARGGGGGAATQEELDSIAEGIGVETPSTPASIESAVDGLIADANTATGEADETLTDAVGTLIDAMPSGSISITENGTVDVAQYARADVNVPLPLEAKYSSNGKIYTEHVVVPDAITTLGEKVYSIDGIKSINLNNVTTVGHYACGENQHGLVSLVCPKLTSTSSYLCLNGVDLETVQLGSIGYPVTSLPTINWLGTVSGRSSGGFTITIYVDATQWADIPAEVTRNPMGGSAEFCTALIYRNSTTGEIIEEPPEPLGYAWVPKYPNDGEVDYAVADENGLLYATINGGRRTVCSTYNGVAMKLASYGSAHNMFITAKSNNVDAYYYVTWDNGAGGNRGTILRNNTYGGIVYNLVQSNVYSYADPSIPHYSTDTEALAAMDDGNWTPD